MGFFSFRKKTKKGVYRQLKPQIAVVREETSNDVDLVNQIKAFSPDVDLLLKDYSYFTDSIFSEDIFGGQSLSDDNKLYSVCSSSASDISSTAGKRTLSGSFNYDTQSDSTKVSKDEHITICQNGFSSSVSMDSTGDNSMNITDKQNIMQYNNNGNIEKVNKIDTQQPCILSTRSTSVSTFSTDPSLTVSQSPTSKRTLKRLSLGNISAKSVIETKNNVITSVPRSINKKDRPDLPFGSDKDGKDWYAHTMERMRKRHRQEYRASSQRIMNAVDDTAIIPTSRTASLIHYAGNSTISRKSLHLPPSQTDRNIPQEKYARQSFQQGFDPYNFHQCTEFDYGQQQCRSALANLHGRSRQSYVGHYPIRDSLQQYTENFRGSFLDMEPVDFRKSMIQYKQQLHNTHQIMRKSILKEEYTNLLGKRSSKFKGPNDYYSTYHGNRQYLNGSNYQHTHKNDRVSDIIALFPESMNNHAKPNDANMYDKYNQQYSTAPKQQNCSAQFNNHQVVQRNSISSPATRSYHNDTNTQYLVQGHKHIFRNLPEKTSSCMSAADLESPPLELTSQCSHHRPHHTMINRRTTSSHRNSSRTNYPVRTDSNRHSYGTSISNSNGFYYHPNHDKTASLTRRGTAISCSHTHNKRRNSRCNYHTHQIITYDSTSIRSELGLSQGNDWFRLHIIRTLNKEHDLSEAAHSN
ncbi:hypothetical protein BDF20DRAFT_912928 [Mycotypha africana]|uniref:uncharacterized protein n=1 Tax=Mycotypha africana TaxID=64632 RepID=UPI0023009C5F|nr:uncharacterized protein BDF20DRAFT_912928 [Mycotypha africana]KAI8979325.1 hypothetical protein BDF20DRAFT_912928 [Mycotypha africana]